MFSALFSKKGTTPNNFQTILWGKNNPGLSRKGRAPPFLSKPFPKIPFQGPGRNLVNPNHKRAKFPASDNPRYKVEIQKVKDEL